MKKTRLRSRPKPSTNDPILSGAWFRAVVHRKAVCVVCGRKARQGHHVADQQWIRSAARTLRLTDPQTQALLWDVRNGAALCVTCHELHTSGAKRIPRRKLPASAILFVEDLDRRLGTEQVMVKLERAYPLG